MKKYLPYFLIALGIILIDQAIKLYIHARLGLGEEIPILGDWFKLHYTLNPGMAFGVKIGSPYGKLGLTFFRIIAGICIIAFIVRLSKQNAPVGLLLSMAMILGGAFGNVVDSVFYGVFIEGNAVSFYGQETPPLYPWFHGKVIDMFYFDIAEGYFPNYIPFLGGKRYSFFPIFNFADAAIFVGVFVILIFQKRFFPKKQQEEMQENEHNDDFSEEQKTSTDNAQWSKAHDDAWDRKIL